MNLLRYGEHGDTVHHSMSTTKGDNRKKLVYGGISILVAVLVFRQLTWLVLQSIAILAIIVVTLPLGISSPGDFFKSNRLYSVLAVFPLVLFVWVVLCTIGVIFLIGSFDNQVHIVLLGVVLTIIALYSLNIAVLLRTERVNISRRILLYPYIYRVSMLSISIMAILNFGFLPLGLALQWIVLLVIAGVSLPVRIFSSEDFFENNTLYSIIVVFPLSLFVLCTLYTLTTVSSSSILIAVCLAVCPPLVLVLGVFLIDKIKKHFLEIVVGMLALSATITIAGWVWVATIDDGLDTFVGQERVAAEDALREAHCDDAVSYPASTRVVKDDSGEFRVLGYTWWGFPSRAPLCGPYRSGNR